GLLFWAVSSPTVPCLNIHIEPEEGSLAGGTWITVIFDGLELGLLHPANGSQLEIHLVNVALPTLPSIPCDVSPVFLDVPAVMCRTRSLLPEAQEGVYSLEVQAGGQVVGSPHPGPQDSCTFKSTPKSLLQVYQAAGDLALSLSSSAFQLPILLLPTLLGNHCSASQSSHDEVPVGMTVV
uniref:PKHD1 ciliary IPT domain containing fibrocystin/polyductin n=1 Tax=Moschus moschiferus TaxID=68415 RepID=A0A8C6DM90_MOSMO